MLFIRVNDLTKLKNATTSHTFPRFALDVDGLRLIIAIFILDAHKVRVCLLTEVGAKRHHIVIAVADDLHHLQGQTKHCISLGIAGNIILRILEYYLYFSELITR